MSKAKKLPALDPQAIKQAKKAAKAKALETYHAELATLLKPYATELANKQKDREEYATKMEELDKEIAELEVVVAQIEGKPNASAADQKSSKRERLGAERLADVAKSILNIVRNGPKEGVRGGQIKAKIAELYHGYKIGTPLPFLNKYANDHGVVMTGQKGAARYHLA
jgi:hypothetical protein